MEKSPKQGSHIVAYIDRARDTGEKIGALFISSTEKKLTQIAAEAIDPDEIIMHGRKASTERQLPLVIVNDEHASKVRDTRRLKR